jgi:TonB family protein
VTLNDVAASRLTIIVLGLVFSAAFPTWAQTVTPPSKAQIVIDFNMEYFTPRLPTQLDPRVLSSADKLVNRIKEFWSVPPEHQSDKGLITATLTLDRTGSVSDIAIVQPSSVEAFNVAAVNALAHLNPTPLLPEECPTDPLQLTASFFFNVASIPGTIAPPGDWPPPNALPLGNGVTLPRLLKEVKPKYTRLAMKAGITGAVLVSAVVQKDGTIGRAIVVRSLDQTFGLDEEALDAVRQWAFVAGTRMGEPVDVIVTIEMTFTLK